MNQVSPPPLYLAEELPSVGRRETAGRGIRTIPFYQRLANIRRNWFRLTVWMVVCVGIAFGYCLLATPKYLVSTEVVLEPRQPLVTPDTIAQPAAPMLDGALADSQVQVIQSGRNLAYVFNLQHLENDPEFAQSGFSPITWLTEHIPFLEQPPLSPEEQAKRNSALAFENFAKQVSARRVAQSYAIELSFYADSPTKAVRIANAITAAYILDKLRYNIKAAAAQRGGDFLQNRIDDVRAEQKALEDAVRTGVIPDMVFGRADARIISSATEPLKQTYPKTTLLLALAAVFSLLSGIGLLILFDELDRRIRSAGRLRILTGVSPLVALPAVKVRRPSDLLQWARLRPQSRFAAEMRKLRVVALQPPETGERPAIGILSYRRGEGASVVAANLADLISEAGTPAALVDGYVFHPTLTRAFAPLADSGLADGCLAPADLPPLLQRIGDNLAFLPACSASYAPDLNGGVFFKSTNTACAVLAQSHFVVVELPPLSESAEGLAVVRSLAGVILVVDAAAVTVDEFEDQMDRLAEADARLLGVVLNKAELS